MEIITSEQQAIVNYVRAGKGDLLIEAVAGSGKTFALLKALEVIPQRSVLICAFNRKIADELKARAPKPPRGSVFHVQTFHSIGKSILTRHYPKLRFDRNGTENIINKTLGERTLPYPMRRAAVKLLRQYKELDVSDGVSLGDLDDIEQVGHTHECFGELRDGPIVDVCSIVLSAYELSHRPNELDTIDFCDMIWMPIALGLTPPSRYQAIVVDEWQDISEPQLELIRRMRAPKGGRLIMAGDGRQALYGYRGAVAAVVRNVMTNEQNAKTLSLTISFRCSKAVLRAASELVSGIRAPDDALDGTETSVGLCDVPRMIIRRPSDTLHTFILSRTNAALLDTALYLWREGVRFQLNAGQEMMAPLFTLLDVLDLRTPDLFRVSLFKWHTEQVAKAEISAVALELVERLNEQRAMLLSAVHYTQPNGLRRLFQSILEPGKTGVLLSTVHKVKGLEADRVFLLRQTFRRHQYSTWKDADNELDQIRIQRTPTEEDLNIEYVAITRSKEHLIWVDITKREIETAPVDEAELTAQMLKSLSVRELEIEFDKAEGELSRLGALGDNDGADGWAKHAEKVLAEISSR